MKIAIFGGTFDPIHRGHITIITKLFEMGMDKVLVIPTNISYYKKNNAMFTFEQRIRICEDVIKQNEALASKNIEVSNIEEGIEPNDGYAHTLLKIKDIYPNDELYTVIGSDSYNYINTWREYQLIPKYSKLIVALRPNNIIDNSIGIDYIKLEMNDDTSSTNIRKQINDLILNELK